MATKIKKLTGPTTKPTKKAAAVTKVPMGGKPTGSVKPPKSMPKGPYNPTNKTNC
jgi:hypothetical protein